MSSGAHSKLRVRDEVVRELRHKSSFFFFSLRGLGEDGWRGADLSNTGINWMWSVKERESKMTLGFLAWVTM